MTKCLLLRKSLIFGKQDYLRVTLTCLINFTNITDKPENVEEKTQQLINLISDHIQSQQDQFKFYFGDLNVQNFSMVGPIRFLHALTHLIYQCRIYANSFQLTSDATLNMLHQKVSW